MAAKLVVRDWDSEAAGDLGERRWFALLSAIKTLESECAVLLEASKLAEVAWRRACAQRAEFESLRDALEDQLKQPQPLRCEVRSGFRGAGTH
jgi:hypothetical protein